MLGVLILAAGIAPAALFAETPAGRRPPWERTAIVGRVLYRGNCSVCHEINRSEKGRKFGPSLFRFFQNEKTPLSGIEPTEAFLRAKIKVGGPVMPPFRGVLSEDQIDKIVNYVRSRH